MMTDEEFDAAVLEAFRFMLTNHNARGGATLVTIAAAAELIGGLAKLLQEENGFGKDEVHTFALEIMANAFNDPIVGITKPKAQIIPFRRPN